MEKNKKAKFSKSLKKKFNQISIKLDKAKEKKKVTQLKDLEDLSKVISSSQKNQRKDKQKQQQQEDLAQQEEQSEETKQQEEGNEQQLETEKIQEKEQEEQTLQINKGAWIDEDDKNINVDISQVARLRKLRKSENEVQIKGDEYQKRLQSFYEDKLMLYNFYKWGHLNELKDQITSADITSHNKDTNRGEEAEEEEQQDARIKQINDAEDLKQLLTQQYDANEIQQGELPQNIIDIERIGITSSQDKHEAVVQSLDFHANNQVFLSSALDKVVKIYSIQENRNHFREKIKIMKSIYLEGMPVTCSKFINQNQILSSGFKKHLICYDLISDRLEKISSFLFTQRFSKKLDKFVCSTDGNYISLMNDEGYIVILSGKTKQFQFELKQNQAAKSVCFSPDSKYLYSVGQGKIYQWDLNKRQIFNVINDEGIINSNSINISQNGNYIVSGSENGLINVYSINKATEKIDKSPIKVMENLTTSICSTYFNQQSEILISYTKWKKNGIRLAHVPTFTTFQNWPNMQTNLKFVTSTAISPNSKYLTIGNDNGNIYLYNLKYYNQANLVGEFMN